MMTRWPTGQPGPAPLGRFPGSSTEALGLTPWNSPWPRFLALTSSLWMTAWTWILYQRTPCSKKQRRQGSKTGAATEEAGAGVVMFKTLISYCSELQSRNLTRTEAGLMGASDTCTGSFLSTFNTLGGRVLDILAGEAACAGSAWDI